MKGWGYEKTYLRKRADGDDGPGDLRNRERDGADRHGNGHPFPISLCGAGHRQSHDGTGPATLILSSLADGPKHGYALTKDVESFAGVRLAPGTLYEALARLESQGMIEALEAHDRRRPYQLTAVGAVALKAHLDAQRRVTDVGLRRLAVNWRTG